MVERDLYKTKLCILYQRGRCNRQYCNFAHGETELRPSFNGRHEYRGRDLRERLDRNRSPLRNYSPARTRHSSLGDSSRSPGRMTDTNRRKRQQLDVHSDYSGSLRMSDGTEDQIVDKRQNSSDSKMLLYEQLRQVQSEIRMLDRDKHDLKIYLQEKAHEADTLTSKIHELEMQLAKEKEEGKRVDVKIMKFIKAHNHHSRLQEEVKRSHSQLHKLGEQLDLPGNNEDDFISNISEDETGVDYMGPFNERQMNSSPIKKRSRVYMETRVASNQVAPVKGGTSAINKIMSEKVPLLSGNHEQLKNGKKPNDTAPVDKVPESVFPVPPTGLAAHAMDEDVEVVETDEKLTGEDNTQDTAKSSTLTSLPPPPPVTNVYYGDNNCSLYL